MRDKISQERAMLLHPAVRQEVIDTITEVENKFMPGTVVRIVQGLRTIEEQDKLYAQGRTAPGNIVTNAPGGKSYHNYGLAIDIVILVNGQVYWDHPLRAPVVAAFKKKGWKWGGEFKSIVDKPHLEKSFGYTVKQLFAKYKKGEYVTL